MTENPFIPDYDDPPSPPAVVYKYVAPVRLRVLVDQLIRFTPLISTNDVFEVRQTFEQIAGPRFQAALHHEADVMSAESMNAMMLEELQKAGFNREAAEILGPTIARAAFGDNYADAIRNQAREMSDIVVGMMNRQESIDGFLERLGGRLLALSLSEVSNSTVMWAHYAQQSEGFAIGFDTNDLFFHEGKGGKSRALQKIAYFDGRVDEVMDDPRLCLLSKTSDWAYEREWRLYVNVEDADRVEKPGNEDIHLMAFPTSAVCKVILGCRASPELTRHLRELLSGHYPHVALTKMKADRRSAQLIEIPL
jgi:hypothetical protein